MGAPKEDYVMIGAGFAKPLYKHWSALFLYNAIPKLSIVITIFSSEASISTTVLMKFCDEGFNDTDANQLASFVNAWSQIVRHFFLLIEAV